MTSYMTHGPPDMSNVDENHEIYPVDGDYIEYPDVWDENVAHEVTVDGEEYIEVDVNDVNAQYMGAHDSNYQEYHEDVSPHHMNVSSHGHHMQTQHLGHLRQQPMDILPLRDDGTPLFTLNLNDLLSKTHPVPGGGQMIISFNKKCQPQLAYDGYLYTLNGTLNQMAYNIWRCSNEHCLGAMRSSPNFAALKLRTDHNENCIPDDPQLRCRIACFDLRLMAEFTVCELERLYMAYVQKIKQEQPDIADIFPTYQFIQGTLEHHRVDQTFRKRFEYRKCMQQRRREGLVIERSKFKRTKAFPPSICVECNQEFPSGDLAPSQDLLIQHLTYVHERPLVIERYTFPDPTLFEQWIRELSQHSRYRMRRIGLYDEHMYYLCSSDDRQQRCNHGRGSILSTQCSAFIRVHDWRYILRREMKTVIVDYCLDHVFHSGGSPLPDSYRQPLYDYYSPEVFMKEIETRKVRTQKMLSTGNGIRTVRRLVTDPQPVYTEVRPSPVEDVYLMDQQYQDIDMQQINQQDWLPEESYDQGIVQQPLQPGRVSFNLSPKKDILRETEANRTRSGFLREFQSNHVTVRENFEDRATFEAVLQLELNVDLIKQRMQQCRRAEIARRYLQRITTVLEDIMADPHCSPKSNGVEVQEPEDASVPGPSTSRIPTKLIRGSRSTLPPPSKILKTVATPSTTVEGSASPVRQAMFLKRGENGEMIVVKRVIKKVKVRKAVPVAEEIVQPAPTVVRTEDKFSVNGGVSNVETIEDSDQLVEAETNFLEPPRRTTRIRRPRS